MTKMTKKTGMKYFEQWTEELKRKIIRTHRVTMIAESKFNSFVLGKMLMEENKHVFSIHGKCHGNFGQCHLIV